MKSILKKVIFENPEGKIRKEREEKVPFESDIEAIPKAPEEEDSILKIKPKKKKEKVYYSAYPPGKDYRPATEEEAVNKKKVNLWGMNKVSKKNQDKIASDGKLAENNKQKGKLWKETLKLYHKYLDKKKALPKLPTDRQVDNLEKLRKDLVKKALEYDVMGPFSNYKIDEGRIQIEKEKKPVLEILRNIKEIENLGKEKKGVVFSKTKRVKKIPEEKNRVVNGVLVRYK